MALLQGDAGGVQHAEPRMRACFLRECFWAKPAHDVIVQTLQKELCIYVYRIGVPTYEYTI